MRDRLYALIFFGAVLSALPFLFTPFFATDWMILDGFRQADWKHPLSVWRVGWGNPLEGLYFQTADTPLARQNYLRPLLPFAVYWQYLLFGERAAGYRLVSLGIYLLYFFLLAGILKAAQAPPLARWSLLFLSLHPALTHLPIHLMHQDVLLLMLGGAFSFRLLQRESPAWGVAAVGWLTALIHEAGAAIFLMQLWHGASAKRWAHLACGGASTALFLGLLKVAAAPTLILPNCPLLLRNLLTPAGWADLVSTWTVQASHTLLLVPPNLTYILPPMRLLVERAGPTQLVILPLILTLFLHRFRRADERMRRFSTTLWLTHVVWLLPFAPLGASDLRWAPAACWLFLSLAVLASPSSESAPRWALPLLLGFVIALVSTATFRQHRHYRMQQADLARKVAFQIPSLLPEQADRAVFVGVPQDLLMHFGDLVRHAASRSDLQVYAASLRDRDTADASVVYREDALLIRERGGRDPLAYEALLLCGRRPRVFRHPDFTLVVEPASGGVFRKTWRPLRPLRPGKDIVLLVAGDGMLQNVEAAPAPAVGRNNPTRAE